MAISLIREDGSFLVRYPSNELVLRNNLLAHLQGGREASFVARSPVDHLERLYHAVRVPGFPVYATYSIDRAAILAEWHRDLWFFGLISAGVGLVLFLASWLALQRARQEAKAVHSLRQTSLSLAEEVGRRERAEASLLQWQRLEAVGQLTGGIAHDFNNLLTIILGNLQLADRRADVAGMRRLHDAMRQAAERGAGLTRQLLAFSRQQALHPEAADLNSVLQNTRAWISRGIAEDVEIGFDLQSDLWPAQVDVGEFEAAILNIAVNARDAMPQGGRLTIRTRNLEHTQDDTQHHPNLEPGPYVCVSLQDSGIGMPPDVLARVYEPFFTTKEVGKGTGLGLSRVYGFVQQSGGSIKVESQVGQGTTVSIYLPRSSAPAAAPREDNSEAFAASGTGTVLVVEDNEDLRKVTVSLLHDLGYSTMVARNGIEALAVLQAGEPVDLLFSDIVMPRGMTGVQLAREALALQPNLKVLLTTGFSGSHSDHDFAVLQKPFSEAELSGAVSRAMLNDQASQP